MFGLTGHAGSRSAVFTISATILLVGQQRKFIAPYCRLIR